MTSLVRHREHHEQPIFAVAFNQIDPSLSDVFATVGANCATIYRLKTGIVRTKLKRGKPEVAATSIAVLQSYCDEDSAERFFCCDWGIDEAYAGQAGASLLAIGGEQRQIKVLDCRDGHVRSVLHGHGGQVHDVRFHPQQRSLLLSGAADESIRLWHVGTRDCIASFSGEAGHRDAVLSIDVRIDGCVFASCGVDGCVKVWTLQSEQLHRCIEAASIAAGVASRKPAREGGSAAKATAAAEASTNDMDVGLSAVAGSVSCAAECVMATAARAQSAHVAPAPDTPSQPSASQKPVMQTMPSRVEQFPLASFDSMHADVEGLSFWVDCVRWVGRLLITRGTDGRTVLWEPPAVSLLPAPALQALPAPCGPVKALAAPLFTLALAPPPCVTTNELGPDAGSDAGDRAGSISSMLEDELSPASSPQSRTSHTWKSATAIAPAVGTDKESLAGSLSRQAADSPARSAAHGQLLKSDGSDEDEEVLSPDARGLLGSAYEGQAEASLQATAPLAVVSEHHSSAAAAPSGTSPAGYPPTRAYCAVHAIAEVSMPWSANTWFLRYNLDARGTRFALGNTKGSTSVWAVDGMHVNPKPLATLTIPHKPAGSARKCLNKTVVRHTAFSADGVHLVCGCDDGSVCVWQLP